jgi:ketosteroid isomerase-like protein
MHASARFKIFTIPHKEKKMNRVFRIAAFSLALSAVLLASSRASSSGPDAELLQVREQVWRAWFDGDTKTVQQLVPSDSIVMSASDPRWKTQADVLEGASEFHNGGGKLLRLEFPRTEVQHFGDVAIVWSAYLVETEEQGKRSTSTGRITEIFVRRDGRWVNPGWHSDPGK